MLYRSDPLWVVAWGAFGVFTRPEFRADPVTYPVIPPPAAEGIVRSIFWHPEANIHEGEPSALGVEIQKIWVMNPIQTIRFRLNEIGETASKTNPLHVETARPTSVVALRDPKFGICFQYVSRTSGHLVKKASEIFKRRLAAGQNFQQPCFGRRRYTAFVREKTEEDVPLEIDMDLGKIPWRIEYDAPWRGAKRKLHTFSAHVNKGVVEVPLFFDTHPEAAL